MADTLNLLGVIGTWAAVLLAIIALVGIIPAYLLYRESQTDHYEALSLIDDRLHEYISKGYLLLPRKRFFRSIKVPNLTKSPSLDIEAPNSKQVIIKRECDLLDRDGSPSLTSWINFANILRAYNIRPTRDGKLKISGTEALLPVHRSWILLLGLIDRYGRRDDSGLFIDEASDPDWIAFSSKALYGLSGVLERIHPGRDRICFRMHSITHMISMSSYIPAEDISPKNLFFLYLGYLPASDGSLYCSAVESERESNSSLFVYRSSKRGRNVLYKMKELNENEVPIRDRRLAEEMGIKLPKIRKLSLYKSFALFSSNSWRTLSSDHNIGLLDNVQYFRLNDTGEIAIWLNRSETQSMILALLRLDLNAQTFLCADDLKNFLERLLPARDTEYLFHMANGGADRLQIQDEDKTLLQTAISEVTNFDVLVTKGRRWASTLAKLDEYLQSLRQKYNSPEREMQTMAILYLTNDEFSRLLMELDPRHIDPDAMFSINIAQKKVHVPAIAHFAPADFDFDFTAVFNTPEDEKEKIEGSLTLPLWQVMLASFHAYIKWNMWSTVLSAQGLSAFHMQLNRTVYISSQDLPDYQEDMGERLQDVANACREFTGFIRKAPRSSSGRKGRRFDHFVEREEEGDDDWDEGDDDSYDNNERDIDEREEQGEEEVVYYDDDYEASNGGDSAELASETTGFKKSLPHKGRQISIRFNKPNICQDEHMQSHSLLSTTRQDVQADEETLGHQSNHEGGEGKGLKFSEAATNSPTYDRVTLTWKQQEEKFLPGLEKLLACHQEIEEEILTREFRKVIGPIILMARSLPTLSFATLLGVPQEIILSQVDQLHSAIGEPVVSPEPIELVDISFRDFILNPLLREKNKFWVDEVETHKSIAMRCLKLISQSGVLWENICGLEKVGHARADISSQKIEDALPAHVQYACRYWVHHFDKGKCSLSSYDQGADFLKDHFLHWMEVLSLMGCTDEGIVMINTLRSLAAFHSPQLSFFLNDAWRFLSINRDAIDEAPLQLYSSALIYLPESGVLKSAFQRQISKIYFSTSSLTFKVSQPAVIIT